MTDERGSDFGEVERGPDPEGNGGAADSSASGTGLQAAHPTVAALRERFEDAVLRHEVQAGDEHVVFVPAERNVEILGWLRDESRQRYDFLSDVTAVDYGGGRPIQVVYQLWSIPHRQGLRVKCELPLSDLEIDTIVPLWEAANWLEREVYDMFGIRFRNHPDLRRILMPEFYAEGHPLRKDFPLRGRFSRAEQTRRALTQNPEDHYPPSEFGPGRDPQVPQVAGKDTREDRPERELPKEDTRRDEGSESEGKGRG